MNKYKEYNILYVLTLLFNKSLSLGVCPNKWKISFMVPFFGIPIK